MKHSLRGHTHHIDSRLQFRLRLYIVISFIFIGIFIYNIARGSLRIDYGFVGILSGIGIGIITSRMFHTTWNNDTKKVVSRLDMYGLIILAIYIFFEIFREKVVGYFTHDFQVGTVGFAVLAGIMFGRVLGTRGKIINILKQQHVF